jgi:hypothetical protein
MHIFYALYDETTRELSAISGSPFNEIPNGLTMCKVYERDGMAFNSGIKHHHSYFVDVNSDGYAEFINREVYLINQRFSNRYVIETDRIQDLNYREIFFDYIDVKYLYNQNSITLTFDVDTVPLDYQEAFIGSMKSGNRMFKIFITEFQDTTALLSNFTLNLFELTKSKKLTVPFKTDKHISLWGIKA